MRKTNNHFLTLATAALAVAAPSGASAASEAQALDELRNTVVNLLQTLVERGVMTREQATQLVSQAQQKAAEDAAAAAKADAGAVRVTYVPQIVREQIGKEVAGEMRSQVVDDVVSRARAEGWGVPGALPDWLGRVSWEGDIRVRAQSDLYADGNTPQFDFLTINDRGGVTPAGVSALSNIAEDRHRLRVQARLGLEAGLGGGFTAGARLVTGTLREPGSLNQTLGTYGGRFQTGFDQAYVRWSGRPVSWLDMTVQGGRFANPWNTTDLVFDRDLTFDGLSTTLRFPFGGDRGSHLALTLGYHPIEEVALSQDDKTLLAGQMGLHLVVGRQRFRVQAGYYDFRNVQGRRNAFDSTALDFTAPRFLQKGNTLFDIRNDLSPDTNLFALAGKYEIAEALVGWEAPLRGEVTLGLTGHFVRNLGWKSDDVLRNSGIAREERTDGYQAELTIGHRDVLERWRWRAFFNYRYLQRDAVLDAFADSDLRLGGTDVKGYVVGADLGLYRGTWLRLRYLTGDQIDGAQFAIGPTTLRPQFGVDVLQLDVNAQF